VEGLSYHTEHGWVVHVFTLIVGIREMVDSSHVQSLLRFLGIQRHWQVVIDQMALASVRAFHFLHTVRFGGPLERAQLGIDPNSSNSASEDDTSNAIPKRRHHTTSKHFIGDDSDFYLQEYVRLQQEA
jgi:hypothetical protein